MKITALSAREILDSRGVPTVKAYITIDDRYSATGAVPSGASTGSTEVLELRDGDPDRYFGKGVLKAVQNVNKTIARALVDHEFATQRELDNLLIQLDGTPLKTNLGGNSILAVSMAFAKAAAKSMNIPVYEYFGNIYWGNNFPKESLVMPMPMILIMEGGRHGNWSSDIQEYMVVPKKSVFPEYADALRAGSEIFHATHDLLAKRGYATTVGFEGAFAPLALKSNDEAFDLILQGVELAGYRPGEDIVLATDIAASEFFNAETNKYDLRREGLELSATEWTDLLHEWSQKYPLWSIEDPLHEDDWDNWVAFKERFGDEIQLVGDDLLTTNVGRIEKAIGMGAVNSVLIKLNQIGSVSETLDAIKMSVDAGYQAVISHRGGETNDDIIADLVVGTDATQSKFGGPDRGERIAKYNRLSEIDAELKKMRG